MQIYKKNLETQYISATPAVFYSLFLKYDQIVTLQKRQQIYKKTVILQDQYISISSAPSVRKLQFLRDFY